MRIISQFLLTFLLNSLWQIALIAALATLGAWLLRDFPVRYRHWLWVSALCLAFLVPTVTSLRTLGDTAPASPSTTYAILASEELFDLRSNNSTVDRPSRERQRATNAARAKGHRPACRYPCCAKPPEGGFVV